MRATFYPYSDHEVTEDLANEFAVIERSRELGNGDGAHACFVAMGLEGEYRDFDCRSLHQQFTFVPLTARRRASCCQRTTEMEAERCPECGSYNVMPTSADSEGTPCARLCNDCGMYSGYEDEA